MKTLLLLLPLLALSSQQEDGSNRLSYEITHRWNGEEIADHSDNPIKVDIFPVNGDLGVEVSGPVFGSPSLPEKYQTLPNQCPPRSYKHLYKQEVVEVYFANDANQYLQVQVSPFGHYLTLLFKDRREHATYALPLEVTRNKECSVDNCSDGFSNTVVIPRAYLPRQVTRFNAHAQHGPNGVDNPSRDQLIYESLYPVDPEVVPEPDFHYLEAFQPIDLSSIGFEVDQEDSQVWRESTCVTSDVQLGFNISQRSDCEAVPEGYHAQVDLVKNTDRRVVTVRVRVTDVEGVVPNVPEKFRQVGPCKEFDSTSESFWVSFSNKYNESVRIGVNPYGVYRVQLFNGLTELEYDGYSLKAVQCQREEGSANWECYLEIPQCVLPPKARYFQVVHAHVGLTGKDGVQPTEFVGAVCPGVPSNSIYSEGSVDWQGCLIDKNLLVNRYSKVWLRAVKEQYEQEHQNKVDEEQVDEDDDDDEDQQ